ncbi:MAG: hypothetical protein MRY21_05610 [Simkaniaceae bacterium]|nr:hypothetical protein [Simkaniaceae bacterium]
MKKAFLFLASLTTLFAADIDFNAAYFRPDSGEIRDIYGEHWFLTEAKITQELYEMLNIWGGVGYTYANGKSIGEGDRTRMQIVPLTLGLKLKADHTVMGVTTGTAIGAGMRYFFLKINNHSDEVAQKVTRNGPGAIVEVSNAHYFTDVFHIDYYLNYSFRTFGIPRSKPYIETSPVAVGGLTVGGGLGFRF